MAASPTARLPPLVLCAVLGASTLSSSARANGRFPQAQRLIEDRADPNRLLLTATYGMLVTRDRGQSWQHICERSYALAPPQEVDAVGDIVSGGAMLASAFGSLNRSSAGGCDFTRVLGAEAGQNVYDFSVDRADASRAIAIVSSIQGNMAEHRLFETADGGLNWTELGVPLPAGELRVVQTLDAAPSDPQRIYVTGTNPLGQSVILRSVDRAASWRSFPLPTDTTLGEFAYIGAVDPQNPDIVYARTDLWRPNDDGLDEGADRLLYSSNGGESWRDVYQAIGKLFGFALSPDGGTLLIGYGDPVTGARVVDPDALGLYKSSTANGAFSFTKILTGSVGCAAWTGTGVYVCTSQLDRPFEIGFAQSADFTLAMPNPLEPLFRLTDITGPFECPACTSGAVCTPDWRSDCEIFGACVDGGGAGAPPLDPCPDGGAGTAGTGGGSGGSGGSGANGGVAGSGVDAGTGGSGAGLGGGNSPPEDDCGCRTPGSSNGPRFGALLACGAAAFWFRRRIMNRWRSSDGRARRSTPR